MSSAEDQWAFGQLSVHSTGRLATCSPSQCWGLGKDSSRPMCVRFPPDRSTVTGKGRLTYRAAFNFRACTCWGCSCHTRGGSWTGRHPKRIYHTLQGDHSLNFIFAWHLFSMRRDNICRQLRVEVCASGGRWQTKDTARLCSSTCHQAFRLLSPSPDKEVRCADCMPQGHFVTESQCGELVEPPNVGAATCCVV